MSGSGEVPRSTLNRRHLLQAGGLSATAAGALTALTASAEKGRRTTARAMRRPLSTPAAGKGLPAVPAAGVVALNRMAFGPRPGDLDAFDALGATDPDRLAAHVAQQLDPDSIADTELDQRLTDAGFESVGLSADPDTFLATLWDWYVNDNAPSGNTSSSVPRDELTRATFLRAMYGNKQLTEVLTDFWLNHFNVYVNHSSFVRATYPHLDLIIRQNLLGNFRTLLEAVAMSTAMLYYLDNYTSSNAGPNENFSRELFELHTLGSENYLGVMPQSEVPQDGQGRPVGYVDADVFEATRCFTGWSFSYGVGDDGDTGLFHYRNEWHDRFQKMVLGVFIINDQPALKDGRDVLDALASHPGTGRHVARKLCRRLIADVPPQSVVDAAAAVFTDQWQAADQLSQVVETILLSDEFLATWGEKNADRGTDHGHGNAMLVLSGNAVGGVHGAWPGLANGQLFDGADLEVTTDYRRVLSEILIRRMCNPNLGEVFPGYSSYSPLGIVAGTDLPPVFGPEIFLDGFESGDTSSWSSTTTP